MTDLQGRYEEVCGDYILLFSAKHKLDFQRWIDAIGGIAEFENDYCFSLQDIVYDINTSQPKYLITKWQDDMIYRTIPKKRCNFQSYSNGYRTV